MTDFNFKKYLDDMTARATKFGTEVLRRIDETAAQTLSEPPPEDPPSIFTIGEPVPVLYSDNYIESEFEKIYAGLAALHDKVDELSITVEQLALKKKKRK